MNRKIWIISALLPFSVAHAQTKGAADTIIRSSTIEITQVYKPEVKQAVKQDYSPVLPPADNTHPAFKYEVPEQGLYYSYRSLPIRPLSMGRDSVVIPFRNYIKAGIGNLSTIYLDAGIGALRGKNYETDIHAGFLSQKGELAGQKQLLAAVDATGVYHSARYNWEMGANLRHSDFGQYGFDHDAFPNKVATRQTLSGGRISLGMQKKDAGSSGIIYHPTVYASYYTGNNIANETAMGVLLPVTKQIDSSWSVGVVLQADAASISSEFYTVDNNVAQLKVGVDYNDGSFALHAFAGPALGQNNNLYLLPDIMARFSIEDWQMKIGAGISGTITQNTYSQLFAHNPYIYTFPSVQTHSDEVYGFLQKGIGNHITIAGRVSWWQYNYLPMYLNEDSNPERMFVLYEPKVNAISIQGSLRYQIGNAFSVGGSLQIFNYYKLTGSRIWHTPANRINADLLWRPLKGLSATAYLSYAGQNYALDQSGSQIKLKSFVDLGIGAEYEVLSRWSLFLNVNNLLNSKYQRWYGYPAYGINIYGGLRFKF